MRTMIKVQKLSNARKLWVFDFSSLYLKIRLRIPSLTTFFKTSQVRSGNGFYYPKEYREFSETHMANKTRMEYHKYLVK